MFEQLVDKCEMWSSSQILSGECKYFREIVRVENSFSGHGHRSLAHCNTIIPACRPKSNIGLLINCMYYSGLRKTWNIKFLVDINTQSQGN